MQPESNLNHPAANGNSIAPAPPQMPAANRATGGASREFHNVLSDIEDLIKSTTSLTGEDLARAKAKLNTRVTDAKKSIESMGDGVAEKARKTVGKTNEYVRNQPWQAIGIGAGVGLLIGVLLARRG